MKNRIHNYNKDLLKLAKQLRGNLTYGEARLWKYIKNDQLGYDFHRQKVIGNYIVDFYCPELMLAIEIDGGSHDELRHDNDLRRQAKLEGEGIRFLRFSEGDVLSDVQGVLNTIDRWLEINAGKEIQPLPA